MKARGIAAAGMALAATCSLSAQSAIAILAKHLEAQGGLQKTARIHSIRMRGMLELAPGESFPLTVEMARPNKVRVESRAPDGLIYLRLFDGAKGFETDEKSRLYEMAQRDADAEASEGFCGYILDPAAKGVRAEFMEHQEVSGRDTYRMKLTRAGDQVTAHWIDTRTFLELQREEDRDTSQGRRTFVTRFSDFRMVEGIPIPFRQEIGVRFAAQGRVFQITQVELNPALPDSDFRLPAAPTASK
ncbi:MAG TPA: hypothetical protein VFF76_09810 [Holophagaceae bacterium]|nr:hypothetical protein [Holophagaceae bacterium]